jgi:hypothetical protein
MRSPWVSSAIVLAVVAACAPSTFDGLTGGEELGKKNFEHPFGNDAGAPDPSLKKRDPRPISPLSGTWVNTSRPKLTWKLEDGTSGANVELSRTRDFTNPEKYVATGSEHTVERDLEPGIWFWRLQARSTTPDGISHDGVTYGPIWEVLVRGKAKNQTKDNVAGHGGIVDLDADGVPDLMVSFRSHEPMDDTGTSFYDFPTAIGLIGVGGLGNPAAFDPFDPYKLYWSDAGSDSPAFGGGVDMDGDGYGDVLVADTWSADNPDAPYLGVGGSVVPLFGGPPYDPSKPNGGLNEGDDDDDADAGSDYSEDYYGYKIATQPFTKVPVLAAGDFNGDGWGDVAAIFDDVALTMQGNDDGLAFTFFPFESPGPSAPSTFAVAAGDFDGDGLSDLGYTPFDAIAPVRLWQGSAARYSVSPYLTVGSDIALPSRATAVATGDFDGDGFDELAFATTIGGKAAVCVHSIASATLTAHACWISDASPTGFGTTLGAGDTDGDGVDEIFVGGTNGITILTHAGVGYADDTSTFTATAVSGPYSSHFSVFYPGRPGKAQWAVYGTDNHTLYVVEGKGESGFSKQYDFSKMSAVKNLQIQFLRFGTSIR